MLILSQISTKSLNIDGSVLIHVKSSNHGVVDLIINEVLNGTFCGVSYYVSFFKLAIMRKIDNWISGHLMLSVLTKIKGIQFKYWFKTIPKRTNQIITTNRTVLIFIFLISFKLKMVSIWHWCDAMGSELRTDWFGVMIRWDLALQSNDYVTGMMLTTVH